MSTPAARKQRWSYVVTCGCVVALAEKPGAFGVHQWETLQACEKHKPMLSPARVLVGKEPR